MILLRKILFYVLAATYIILCPLTIFYALGYIYKPGEQAGVVKVGVIYAATVPAGADIHIGNKHYLEQTPTTIRELLPGIYDLVLSLKGYQKWQMEVPVEAEKATVLDKILLLPLKWKGKIIGGHQYKEIIPIPENQFFLVQKGDALGDYFVIFDGKTNDIKPLIEKTSSYARFAVKEYYFIEKSPAIIFVLTSEQGDKLLKVEIGQETNEVKDITAFFQEIPEYIEWTPQNDKRVFAFQKGQINCVDTEEGAVYPEYVKEAKGYGLFGNNIYVITDNNILIKMDEEKKNKTVLVEKEPLGDTLFEGYKFFSIKVFTPEIIAFLSAEGRLLSNHLPYKFIDKGVRGIKYEEKNNQLLVWEKDKIGIIDFTKEKTQNVEFEKGPSLRIIFSGGKDIKQAFWVYEGSHILFRDKEEIFLLELEEYKKQKLNFLFKVLEKTNVCYFEETGKMYFIEKDQKNLQEVTILHEKDIVAGKKNGV